MAGPQTVYVYLTNEAVDVWAPADAEHVQGDVYRITNRRGENEMQFELGDLVKCRHQQLSDGECLVAYEKAMVKSQ